MAEENSKSQNSAPKETTEEKPQVAYEDKSTEDVHATAKNAARLLEADVARSQARVSALATGLSEHQEALEDAEKRYDDVRASVDDDAVRYAYSQLINPTGLHSMSRQYDTSGLGGFGSNVGVVDASDVFGSDVQRTVASLAYRSQPEPVVTDPGSSK